MTTLKKIFRNLDEANENRNTGENHEHFIKTLDFFDEYLQSNAKDFSLIEIDEYDQSEVEYQYDILEILYFYKNDTVQKMVTFFDTKTIETYTSLINSLYAISLPIILNYLRRDYKKAETQNVIAMFFFCSLCYFPNDEKVLFLKAMDFYLKDNTLRKAEDMDAANTLFPLAYHLAGSCLDDVDDEVKDIIDQGKQKFRFNSLYQAAYDNFLNEDSGALNDLFSELSDYHIKQSYRSRTNFTEFEQMITQPIPWEILVLLKIRADKGMDNSCIKHPLLDSLTPFVSSKSLNFFDKTTSVLRAKVFTDFGYNPLVSID